ncbi:S1C family serine protease [Streptomyces daliensis]|uniref:Trypsin-like peptidase domain-containing protein n=1 Tax=Streptomyces daliensis TaxID=299421 RepID=A0A8T4IKW8_9ACTN|nr:trypsin-like peptidase domain-containing protein [Streptomyces daliensis]
MSEYRDSQVPPPVSPPPVPPYEPGPAPYGEGHARPAADDTLVQPTVQPAAPQHAQPAQHAESAQPAQPAQLAPGDGFPPPPADGTFGQPAPDAADPGHGRRKRRMRRPVALLAAVAVGAAVIGGGTAVGVQQLIGGNDRSSATSTVSGTNASSAAADGTVAGVAKAVSPSVVEIQATSGNGQSTGSGVVISKDGEILTNNHVVSGSQSVKVTFSNGKTATAEVVGTSPDHDMALIKVQGVSDLTPATLGDSSKVGVGDEVVAIGSPEGLSGTVTSGIVSALDREVTVQKEDGQGQGQGQGGQRWPFEFGGGQYNGEVGSDTTSYKAIQTDASLNPGNSGGALVNMNGEIIGINSAMYSSSSSSGGASASDSGSVGLGFAIPVNDVKKILDDLRDGNG